VNLLLLATALAGPPVELGLSFSGGVKAHVQDGVTEAAASVDLLDFEIHVGRTQIVPRLGRFAVGLAALQITEIEVDVFYALTKPQDGWAFAGAVGVGPRLTVGADQVSGGARLLGRLGAVWRKPDGRFRTHLLAEPFVGVDGGPEFVSADVGIRAAVAFTWKVGK